MKGLALSKRFYEEYGAPMLREQFPALEGLIAVGLAGSGSECFGYDDALSQDHDFEPGFCLFLPDEDTVDRKAAFALERAYAKLPKEFMGYRRSPLSPVGGNRHGVLRMSDFFQSKTGDPKGELSMEDWFFISEQSLAEATNGALFRDDSGEMTAIRERLAYLPEDVRRKKLAGHLLLMGQAGQYNYRRCVLRGETAAAQLAAIEFVNSALHAVFLLNRRYLSYYKWRFHALRTLPLLSSLHEPLEYLISSGNGTEEAAKKEGLIEQIGAAILSELRAQALSEGEASELEAHAYAVNAHIADGELRTRHILYGV
ncbi:MAG: DUF4037 domain-containing protein [Ruminococcaceae bacterium]|nr:DUF4037 domain-containing protein [Oscillospiraceae bacterium]